MEVAQHEAPEAHLLSYFQLFALYVFLCGLLLHLWILYKVKVICGRCCGCRDRDPALPVPRHEEGRIWARGHGNQILMAPYKPYPPSSGMMGSRVNPDEWSLVNLVRRRRWKRIWFNLQSWNWKRSGKRRGVLRTKPKNPWHSSHLRGRGELKKKVKLRAALSSIAGWAVQAHS